MINPFLFLSLCLACVSCSSYNYCNYWECDNNCCYSSTDSPDNGTSVECTYLSYCGTGVYNSCLSGCCFYAQNNNASDYYCSGSNCFSADPIYCPSSNNNNNYSYGSGSDNMANYLNDNSGQTYIVVIYPAWKAAVAVGSIITGIWFFLDIYLIYLKCFAKPKGWGNPPTVAQGGQVLQPPLQQNAAYYQPANMISQSAGGQYEMNPIIN